MTTTRIEHDAFGDIEVPVLAVSTWHDIFARSTFDAALDAPPAFTVTFSPQAAEHMAWLKQDWSVDFEARLLEILSRDPTPHRTRRIRSRHGDLFDIGCGAWFAVFEVKGTTVHVLHLKPAFPLKFLTDPARPEIPDKDAQLAFRARWPQFAD